MNSIFRLLGYHFLADWGDMLICLMFALGFFLSGVALVTGGPEHAVAVAGWVFISGMGIYAFVYFILFMFFIPSIVRKKAQEK